jgi:cellulose synthase (UDP-forming)
MLETFDFASIEDIGSFGWLGVLAAALIALTLMVPPTNRTARALVAVLALACALRYQAWRIVETWPIGRELTPDIAWQWSFALVECAAMLGSSIMWLFQMRFTDRSQQASDLAARMTDYPLVDVFVPTYNESEEILERTLTGALQMDYPRTRIWLLDDKRRPGMAALAARLGVGYLMRADNAHAKAGNMNNGLAHVLALSEPPDLIAILDADFVPARGFLSRTVPFFTDPGIGLVQTPQHFFNPDPMQVNLMAERILPDDQRFAQGVDLPARDAWGVATSCGTSSVVRVASLRAIGGFPYESVCEDTLTSVKLWTLGQRTVFLNEPLTQGLAVEGVAELLSQRGRWSLGNMQILRSEWGLFSRHRMPPLGRLFMVSMFLGTVVSPLMRAMIIASPAIYLFTGSLAIPTDLSTLFGWLGPFLVVQYIGIVWISQGTNLPILSEAATTLEYFATFRAGLVGLFRPMGHKFNVTAKGIDRTAVVVHWPFVIAFSIPIALYIIGLVLNFTARPLSIANTESLIFVSLWCYYNCLMLILGIYMSIDLPRNDRLDVFHLGLPTRLRASGREWSCVVRTLSPTTAAIRFVGSQPPDDTQFELMLPGGLALPCRLKERSRGGINLALQLDETQMRDVVRFLFDGQHFNSVQSCSVPNALMSVMGRALR